MNEKVICTYIGFSGYFADPNGYHGEIACDLESYSKELAATSLLLLAAFWLGRQVRV